MNDPKTVLQIAPVAMAQRAAALDLLLTRIPEARRPQHVEVLRTAAVADTPPWRGLLGAFHDQRMVGAILSAVQTGHAATIWPPQVLDEAPPATADLLLQAAIERLAADGTRLVQALLESDAEDDAATLLAGGFQHAADLLYLVCPRDDFPSARPDTSLQFQPYTPEQHERFARLVEATYRETLDCPQLNGVRDVDDVLAGYRAASDFNASRWLIVRHADADVGCLILTGYPNLSVWELTYMGVVAESRGHGWGVEIAQYALSLAAEAAQSRVVLAVDAQNAPALRMYAAAGFQVWDQRAVYLRQITGKTPSPNP